MRRGWALALAIALLAVACGQGEMTGSDQTSTTAQSGSASTSTTAPSEEPKQLVDWTLLLNSAVNVGPAYMWAGLGMGYFEEEGLRLKVAPGQGAAQATQVIAAGLVDANTPAPDAMVAAAGRGEPLPLVAVFNLVPRLHYWPAVLPDSPIQTGADLAGKVIGVQTLASSAVPYIKAYVAEHGIDPETDIELLPVGQDIQAAEALKNGEVDALALWDVTYSNMMANGYELRFLPQSERTEFMMGNIDIVHSDAITEKHDLVAGFVRATAKSVVFAMANPEAAACVHYEYFPETLPLDVPIADAIAQGAEVVAARVPQLEPLEGMRLGEFNSEGFVRWGEFIGSPVEDAEIFYTNEFIEFANDFDVEDVRQAAINYDCSLK